MIMPLPAGQNQVSDQAIAEPRNIFIDWLKVTAKNENRWPIINSGCVLRIDEHGQIIYETSASIKHEGSHSSSAQIRVTHDNLELSFNPSRYNRTNNLFGCTYEQAVQVANDLLQEIDLEPLEQFQVNRLDVTQNLSTGGEVQLSEYISYLKKITLPYKTTNVRYDAAIYKNSQVYIKTYKKAEELRDKNADLEKLVRNRVASDEQIAALEERKLIADHCQKEGVARIEVEFKRRALIHRGLRHGRYNTHSKIVEAFMKETKQIPRQMSQETIQGLTRSQMGTLSLWKQGYNPREGIAPNTFTAHRRAILDATGYDIRAENIVNINPEGKRMLVKTTVLEVPDWYDLPFSEPKLSLVE